MKLFTIIASFILVLTGFLAAALIHPPQVSAAAAECFVERSTVGDAPFKSISCDSVSHWINQQYGSIEDDTCYLQNGSGWGMKSKVAANDSQCDEWRGEATTTASQPPQCWTVAITSSQYNAGEDEPSDYTRVDCEENGLDFTATFDIEPGKCYLFFQTDDENTYSPHFATCDVVFQHLVATLNQPGRAGSVSVNADREAIASCGSEDFDSLSPDEKQQVARDCLEINPIVKMVDFAVNILSALAGVIIVAMIVAGGIQYSTAGASPQAVGAAKSKIINALIALLALFFVYSFLQWLVPGGIF